MILFIGDQKGSSSEFKFYFVLLLCNFQEVLVINNPPASVGDARDRFSPWVRKIPWIFLECEMATRSISGKIPWTEERGML